MDVLGQIIDDERLKASPEKIARIEARTTLGIRNNYSNFSELLTISPSLYPTLYR